MNTLTRQEGKEVAAELRESHAQAEWRALRREAARHLRLSVRECLARLASPCAFRSAGSAAEAEVVSHAAEGVVAVLVPPDALAEKKAAFPQPLALYNESTLVRRCGADAGGSSYSGGGALDVDGSS